MMDRTSLPKPIFKKLEEMGVELVVGSDEIKVLPCSELKAVDIKTMPYPGFPTDLQQIFGSMLTLAKGTSVIVENIFESRYKYISELIRLGAQITIEGKTAVIHGKRKLVGTTVKASDLRGGAGLLIAGLAAKGRTKIENIEYILRGYENFDDKLRKLGANIKEVNE